MQLSCEKREEETRGDWDGSMRRQEDIPPEKEKEELEYVGKKGDFFREEFQENLSRPPKSYLDYPTYYPMIKRIKPLIDFVSRYISRL
jgi:hypothetical protein